MEVKKKGKEVTEEKDMTPKEYLNNSLRYLTDTRTKALATLQEVKLEIKDLEEDVKNIKSHKLIGACTQALNNLLAQKRTLLENIKIVTVDIKQVNELLRLIK